eukprot:CAMPEP_0170492074 /NCGR_PEP_ID=MMETSP0208-20121228/11624_1 /TAXON_ID=197538 /ORGANISM="Strombidium inclinatum, Strain S3" /LENGTH=59 /DNA_ID=CAMNT_0010767761 /DNA_START=1 /DNA_END=180 /DNA_ORIENTATION=+
MGSNLYLGVWSNQYTRQFFLSMVLIVILVACSLVILQSSVKCVDKEGCLMDHCNYRMFS